MRETRGGGNFGACEVVATWESVRYKERIVSHTIHFRTHVRTDAHARAHMHMHTYIHVCVHVRARKHVIVCIHVYARAGAGERELGLEEDMTRTLTDVEVGSYTMDSSTRWSGAESKDGDFV